MKHQDFHWKKIVDQVNQGFDEFKHMEEPFYHYTSLKSFLGIMNSREFWMSNIHFMNDEQEFYDGQGVCADILEKKLQNDLNPFLEYEESQAADENQKILWEKQYYLALQTAFGKADYRHSSSLWEQQKKATGMQLSSNDIYGISFCRDRNLLSQWQNYGEHGVAIGFDETLSLEDMTQGHTIFVPAKIYEQNKKKMMQEKAQFRFSVTDVIYDEKWKYQIIEQIIAAGQKQIDENIATVCSQQEKEKLMEQVMTAVCGALFYYFTYMKNTAFHQEKECRFVYSFSGTQQQTWPDLIDFRESDGHLVPYIRLKIIDTMHGEQCQLPIREIVVAPGENKEFVADSIRYYLLHHGYEYLVERVTVSDIPYRG
jgi:hypothetical protein